jgi:hypothetical protein
MRITIGVFRSPETATATTAARIRMMMRKLRNWSNSFSQAGRLGGSSNTLGPNRSLRCATSLESSPTAGSTPSWSMASLTDRACQGVGSAPAAVGVVGGMSRSFSGRSPSRRSSPHVGLWRRPTLVGGMTTTQFGVLPFVVDAETSRRCRNLHHLFN